MGKWNYRRRWKPRNYRDQRIPSPPTYYETEFKLRGAWKNDGLPWEERFCISVGIPWEKVITAKKCMYSHDYVVKWDDSAGEEMFCNAKRRFWAEINGLPADVPQPDPDMYIDEIDWNPKIDPEVVKDLELAYFNPDEAEKVDITVPGSSSGCDDKNACTSDNPWEPNQIVILDNIAHGWNHLNSLGSVNISDPWERGKTQNNKEIKDTTWGACANKSGDRDNTWRGGGNGSCNKDVIWGDANSSWRWNQCPAQRSDINNKSTWDRGARTTGFAKGTEWRNNENSCSSNGWKSRGSEFSHSGHIDTSWRKPTGAQKSRQIGRDNSFGRERWYSQHDMPNNLDHRRHKGSAWESNDSCRKREGPRQNTSSYKIARVQADDYGTGGQWRRQGAQNMV